MDKDDGFRELTTPAGSTAGIMALASAVATLAQLLELTGRLEPGMFAEAIGHEKEIAKLPAMKYVFGQIQSMLSEPLPPELRVIQGGRPDDGDPASED